MADLDSPSTITGLTRAPTIITPGRCNSSVSVNSKRYHPPPKGNPRAFDQKSCPLGRTLPTQIVWGGGGDLTGAEKLQK